MKNFFLLILLSLSLVACTDKASTPEPRDKFSDQGEGRPVKELEIKSIGAVAADFGDVAYNEVKIITVRITNNGDEILTGPASLSSSEFSISYQSGCSNLAPGSSCTVKLSVDARSKSPGVKTASLILDSGVSVAVSANILSAPAEGSSIIVSSEVLDFGSLTQTSTVSKTLTIKNNSSGSINQVISVGSSFSKTYDSCSGKNIAPGSSCTVKLSLSGAGKSGLISESLQWGSLTPVVSLTASVSGPTVSSSQMVMVFGGVESETGFSLGQLPLNKTSFVTLSLKNKGTSAAAISDVSENSVAGQIVYNSCLGVSLAPAKSCTIKLSIVPTANENFSLAVSWENSKSFSLSYTVPSVSVSPLALTNLNEGQIVRFADLQTDTDGFEKFTLTGECQSNGEEIVVKIDEFEGQEFDGTPMYSSICYDFGPPNYDCDGSPAVLTTTCQSNQFSVKLPLQHIIDFWYWAPYGGEMELKLNYSNPLVALSSPIVRNFKNYAAKAPDFSIDGGSSGFGELHLFQSVGHVNVRQLSPYAETFADVSRYSYTEIKLSYNGFSSRHNNPRTPLDTITYDYHYNHIDSSGYSTLGEIKFSQNDTCSGGVWKRGTSSVDEGSSVHYFDLLESVTLPTDGTIQYLSFQKRDVVTGEVSDCFVKQYKYEVCPDFPTYCDANHYTVPWSVETYSVPGP